MSLKEILKHFKMTEQEFLNMTDDQWQERTKPILEKLEEEDHDDFPVLEAIAITCSTQAARKKKHEDNLLFEITNKHEPLQVEAIGTPANEAKLAEIAAAKNPPNTVVTQSGADAAVFNYVISSEDKAEIQKNRNALFEEYNNSYINQKSNLNEEEKAKYKPETVTFKTFAELNDSNKLFKETKASYKDMTFPLEITILKFDNFEESKNFMENEKIKPYLTKPVPKPAAEKKEDETDDKKNDKDNSATTAKL